MTTLYSINFYPAEHSRSIHYTWTCMCAVTENGLLYLQVFSGDCGISQYSAVVIT